MPRGMITPRRPAAPRAPALTAATCARRGTEESDPRTRRRREEADDAGLEGMAVDNAELGRGVGRFGRHSSVAAAEGVASMSQLVGGDLWACAEFGQYGISLRAAVEDGRCSVVGCGGEMEAGAARWQSYGSHRWQSFPSCNLLETTFGHVQSLDYVAAAVENRRCSAAAAAVEEASTRRPAFCGAARSSKARARPCAARLLCAASFFSQTFTWMLDQKLGPHRVLAMARAARRRARARSRS